MNGKIRCTHQDSYSGSHTKHLSTHSHTCETCTYIQILLMSFQEKCFVKQTSTALLIFQISFLSFSQFQGPLLKSTIHLVVVLTAKEIFFVVNECLNLTIKKCGLLVEFDIYFLLALPVRSLKVLINH